MQVQTHYRKNTFLSVIGERRRGRLSISFSIMFQAALFFEKAAASSHDGLSFHDEKWPSLSGRDEVFY